MGSCTVPLLFAPSYAALPPTPPARILPAQKTDTRKTAETRHSFVPKALLNVKNLSGVRVSVPQNAQDR